jgi:hypothetical protein
MTGVVVLCVLLLTLGGQQLLAQQSIDSGAPLIRLKNTTFDPQAGEPALAQALRTPQSSGVTTYLVQFNGPIEESWKAAAQAAGAKLYGYVPDNTLIARADAAGVDRLRALPFVRWVGPYHPAYRLEPALASTAAAGDATVMVQTLPDADMPALAAQVAGWGGRVEDQSANAIAGYMRATLPATHLGDLAASDAVLWVEPYFAPELNNEVGGGQIMRANEVRQSLGLFGAGQTVAVADTGMDVGNTTNLHPDIKGRLIKAYCLGRPSPCDWSDPNAHGTHVAGSVLGSGSASGSNPSAHQYAGSHAGVAPEAALVFQSIQASNGSLGGIPNDVGQLMRQAYNDGARIHTNSWGGPTGGSSNPYGGYDANSQQADQAAWEHKDQVILFAAGNSGTDADRNGVIDPDSIGQPGTAKNVITVGASENLRNSGGYNPGGDCDSWGSCWFDDFSASPIAEDTPSDNANGMAAFSSRGPTDDGRIKPDLVAPGTNIVSVRSHHPDAGTGWGVYDSNYIYEGGTSMATPLTAGAFALVREWLTRIKGIANPSAALMKSVLVNGAADMSPGQYDAAHQEIPSRQPNNVTGWGRVDLKAALDPPAPLKVWFNDATTGIATGQSATYQVTVQNTQAAQTTGGVAPQSAAAKGTFGNTGTFRGASAVIPQATSQVLQNGGFENSTFAPWNTFGMPFLSTTTVHSGARSAFLGGYDNADDEVQQAIPIPADASDVTIDFWYTTFTSETFPGADQFCYGLYDPDTYLPYMKNCGDFAAMGDQAWSHEVYSLSASQIADVAGKSPLLIFYVVTDSVSDPSSAWVDDAAVQITTPGGGTTPTPTPTPPPTGGTPLRVTLTWTDYPGEPAAAKALVNDLDLEIIAPNGTHYTGNQGVYTSGQCLRGGKWDACNTIEGVILPQAAAGTYTIVVRGAQVAQGGLQPFALTATGNGLQSNSVPAKRSSVWLPTVRRTSQSKARALDAAQATPTPQAAPAQPAAVKREPQFSSVPRP